LKSAFQDTRLETIRVISRPTATGFSPDQLQSAALIVYTSGELSAAGGSLLEAVKQGKTLLFAPATAHAASNLVQFAGGAALPVHEDRLDRYAMLGQIDFGHPLFAPFADARYSDFTKIHFWKYRSFDLTAVPSAHVAARFDSGDPAIFEIPCGKGRVVVFASGWQPTDSQLALSSKFVPLLYSLLDLGGAAPPPPAQYFVGDTVALAASPNPLKIQLPDGRTVELPQGETNFSQTLAPGIYSVISQQPPRRFAVNVDPAESRTAPLAPDELERLGVPGEHPIRRVALSPQLKVRLENAELEAHQKLWRWFIVGALGVLIVESLLAGWTARRLVPKEENA
jgi:hypothetical protein